MTVTIAEHIQYIPPGSQTEYIVAPEGSIEEPFHVAFARSLGEKYLDEIRADGTTRYDHAKRVVKLQQEYLPHAPSTVTAGIYLHDLVNHFYEENSPLQDAIREDIFRGLHNGNHEESIKLLQGLGFALSAYQSETAGEQWRGETQRMAPEKIAQAIQDSTTPVDADILAFRSPVAPVDTLLKVSTDWDLEATAVIKNLEVIDNVLHPHPTRPAAAWRDAQELLSFYGPLAEIAGFDDIAQLAYSTAHTYLNSNLQETNPELYANAHKTVQSAEQFFYQHGQEILGAFKSISGMHIDARVKTPGSFLNKLIHKYQGIGTCPDTVGFRIKLPNDTTPGYMIELIRYIYETLGGYGCMPGHTKQDEPAIEITMKRFSHQIENGTLDINGQKTNYIAGRQRDSGYSAAHVNNIVSHNGVQFGLEVHLVTVEGHKNNSLGEAAHFLYKAAHEGTGEYADLKRQLNQDKNNVELQQRFKSLQEKLIQQIHNIRLRCRIRERNAKRGGSRLTPTAIKELEKVLGLHFSDEEREMLRPETLRFPLNGFTHNGSYSQLPYEESYSRHIQGFPPLEDHSRDE